MMSVPVLSRRKVLGMLGLTSAASLLAACTGQATPTAQPTQAAAAPKPTQAPEKPASAATPTQAAAKPAATPTPAAAAKPTVAPTPAKPQLKAGERLVTVMYNSNEFKDDHIAQFETANAGIKLYRVQTDLVQLVAMTSAGTPPDIYRVQAPDVPSFLTRKMVKDLTDYFKTSNLIKIDDLADANRNYWYEGYTPGKGKIYGMCKDWSPDMSLFCNKQVFEAAGVKLPGDDEPITYLQLTELAEKLTKKSGDRTEVMGFGYQDSWFDRIVEVLLNSDGKSMWADDFSSIKLTTPEAKKVTEYWFDLDKRNVTFNPLNPSTSWPGDQFTKGQVGIVMYGYWFSAMAESDTTKGNVVMLPAPKWGPQHKSPTITATGHVIHQATKVADDAWKVFEWFSAGDPSVERAKSGWGVPALKSQFKLMPAQTPFQQQVQKVLQHELAISDSFVRFNPYINSSENASRNTFLSSYFKLREAALKGQMQYDQVLQTVEKDVNTAIKEGMDRLA